MINILILSENPALKSEIREYLDEQDYHVVEAQGRVSGEQIFSTINLIILDSAGFQGEISSFIGQIKTQNPLMLIVVLVEQGNVPVTVQSMRAGAIDVLAMPVDKQVLLNSLVDGISRRSQFQQDQAVIQQAIDLLQSLRTNYVPPDGALSKNEPEQLSTIEDQSEILKFGELAINTKQGKAFYQDVPMDLTPSQFRLLSDLGEANGHVVPFEELYFHLHGIHLDRSSARTALSAHMSYLRNKLVLSGCGEYLVNVRGRGYLLEIPETTDSHASIINLDLILEQLPIILWTTNTELRIVSALGMGLIQIGLEPSKLIGLNLVDFPQLEEPSHTISAHRQALLGKSSRYEQVLQGRTFQMYIEPSFDENEQIIGCVGLALDISERKEAEEAYQILVNHSQQGLTIFQNKQFVFANAAAAKLTGYSVEELLALDDPIKLFYSEDRPVVYDNLRRRLAGEEVSMNSEYRIIRKDGEIRWVEQTAFTIKFRGQLAIHTAARDKTQEKQAVDARRQLEEIYRALVKNLPQMAVLLFDHDLRYLIVEGQALVEMGFHRDQMEGRTIWEVLPAHQAETLVPHYHAALEGKETIFDLKADNRIYEVRTLPLKNDDGQIVAGMFIIHDVTRHKPIAP